MNQITVLEWEMHGPSTAVRFCAARAEEGFEVTVKKDGAVALTGRAADGAALLQRSQALRSELRRMGYSPKPLIETVPSLAMGYASGAAMPLRPSLVSLLAG